MNIQKIKIKPFIQPPKIPPNFVETSVTSILLPSLESILYQNNHSKASREELYRTIQDLCTHGHGIPLYQFLVQVLNHAACTIVQRHCYHPIHCHPSLDNDDDRHSSSLSSSSSSNFLHCMNQLWNEYTEYLACVRNIFQHLDNLFLYVPSTGRIIPRQSQGYMGSSRMDDIPFISTAAAAASTSASDSFMDSSASSSSSSSSSTPSSTLQGVTWSLWEVGLFALYRPLMMNVQNTTTTTAAADCDTGLIHMVEPTHSHSIIAHFRQAILSTMTLQLDHGTFCDGTTHGDIIVGRDTLLTSGNNTCTSSSLDIPRAIRDSIFFLQQLHTVSTGCSVLWIPTTITTRNVTQSLFVYTPTSSLTSGQDPLSINKTVMTSFSSTIVPTHSIMQLFVQEMIVSMMKYFSNECQQWMYKMDDRNTINMTSTNYDSSSSFMLDIHGRMDTSTTQVIHSFIKHVDARLKQVHGMTNMYFYPLHIGNHHPNHGHGDGNISIIWNIQQQRFPSRIVELHLLTPLFNSAFILHPRHFYPLLDEPQLLLRHNVSMRMSTHDKSSFLHLNATKNTTDTDEDPKTTAITLEPPPHHHTPNHESFFYIQRLYSLSKRVVCNDAMNHTHPILGLLESIFQSSSPSSSFFKSVSSLLPVTDVLKGLDRLKQSLIEYGECRGLACLRHQVPSTSLDGTKPKNTNMTNNKDIVCKSIIPALLEFKSHLERLNTGAFSNDETLSKSIRNVLEQVLNSHIASQDCMESNTRDDRQVQGSTLIQSEGDGGKYVAEILAKYVDLRFKDPKSTPISSSIESSDTNDSESFQHAVIELFRHIHSKDIFEAFYRRDLSKRLMLNKSISIDAERSFVSKLKAECGSGYTSKMEGMFQDIELSKDVMSMYRSYSVGNKAMSGESAPIDMEVQVLTTGYWPVYPQCASLILPTLLMKQKEHFETYYNGKYQGRRIAWQHSLGTCIIRATFPKIGIRELLVSLPQALVLMCFNDETANSNAKPQGLTISEIMKITGFDDRSEAERVLQSLSLGRDGTRVLTKIDVDNEDKTAIYDVAYQQSKPTKMKKARRTVLDRDLFIFNSSFTSNQHRIKITNIQVKETSDEREKTHEAVSQDRLYLIDAAIVRIMKARKSMEHRTLVGEVMTQIKFPANSSDIKKRIESLIEREYLERAEGDRAQYNYLA